MNQQYLRIHFLLPILACLIWSTAFVGVKIGLAFMRPLTFAGARFFLAGILVLLITPGKESIPKLTFKQMRLIALVGIFQTFLLYGLFHMGMTLIQGALGAIVIGASPLFAALTAHGMAHDDRLSVKKVAGILIGISGVVLISLSRKPWEAGGLREVGGILLLVTGCFCSAIGNVLVSKDKHQIPPLLFNGLQFLFGGFLLLLIALPVDGIPDFIYPTKFYLAFGWLVLIAAAGFSIWFYLLKQPGVKVSELNFWKFIIPVFGAGLAWAMLPDESPNLASIAGMLLVAVAVVVFYSRAGAKKRD